MSKMKPGIRTILLFMAGLSLAGCAGSPSILSPHTTDASRVAGITWLMFAIAAIVLIIVTILILMAVGRARRERRVGDIYADDPKRLRNVLLGGALAPFIVLLAVMALAIGVENAGASMNGQGKMDIEVIGHQWWWEVRYPNQNFETANEIHIPVGEAVTFHLTSADVIHSFWVPELHGKVDTIPGQTNNLTLQVDQPGVYRGQCAEYCGAQHAHMAFLIIAQSQADFQAWLKDQNQIGVVPKVGTLEQTGQQVFLGAACVYCHNIQGTNASGRIGPDLTHLASRQTIGAGVLPNTPGNLAGWILNSQSIKPGNHMPPMDLNGDQIEALLAYLASLK
jgi:cytochrome c oxidase subunit II